jgi:hypothetical protein
MNDIEIIKSGSNDVKKMSAMNCCWPPGTQSSYAPEPMEDIEG